MKNKMVGLFIGSIVLFGCSKDDVAMDPVCLQKPPTDEMCEAYFTRWFYNAETNTCAEIGYGGCSQVGFATKAECEECDCAD